MLPLTYFTGVGMKVGVRSSRCLKVRRSVPPLRLAERDEPAPLAQGLLERLEAAIVYEDKALIVLNKPAGIAVHGDGGMLVHAGHVVAGVAQHIEPGSAERTVGQQATLGVLVGEMSLHFLRASITKLGKQPLSAGRDIFVFICKDFSDGINTLFASSF